MEVTWPHGSGPGQGAGGGTAGAVPPPAPGTGTRGADAVTRPGTRGTGAASAARDGSPCPGRGRGTGSRYFPNMTIARSLLLFALAAVAEIGGAWLVWQGVREQRGLLWIAAGVAALGAYGFVATFQPDANFGRVLAAYGGVFIAGSLLWGMLADGFRPDRWDLIGAGVCLAGVALIMYAPRG
ncbi:hypothetical protein GCM10018952_32020 [Streptosporangium vulgare]